MKDSVQWSNEPSACQVARFAACRRWYPVSCALSSHVSFSTSLWPLASFADVVRGLAEDSRKFWLAFLQVIWRSRTQFLFMTEHHPLRWRLNRKRYLPGRIGCSRWSEVERNIAHTTCNILIPAPELRSLRGVCVSMARSQGARKSWVHRGVFVESFSSKSKSAALLQGSRRHHVRRVVKPMYTWHQTLKNVRSPAKNVDRQGP